MKKTERQKRLEDLLEVQGIEADMMEEVVVDGSMVRPYSVPLLFVPQARLALVKVEVSSGHGESPDTESFVLIYLTAEGPTALRGEAPHSFLCTIGSHSFMLPNLLPGSLLTTALLEYFRHSIKTSFLSILSSFLVGWFIFKS